VRLVQGGVAHLIRGWPSAGVWAVALDVPDNGLTILLMSDKLTIGLDRARPWDLC
jgi:hypothetical protein